jgi:hypothetical protein
VSGIVTRLVSRQALQALIPSATMTPIGTFTQMPVMLKNGLFRTVYRQCAVTPLALFWWHLPLAASLEERSALNTVVNYICWHADQHTNSFPIMLGTTNHAAAAVTAAAEPHRAGHGAY